LLAAHGLSTERVTSELAAALSTAELAT